VKGFSRLGEAAIPRFLEGFLRPVAAGLPRFAEAILHRNTWGDGAFLVVRDVLAAARCGLALQDAARRIDREAQGLPPDLALRIGGHAGPVFELDDPVLGARGFFGSHVTRAARVEPVTPEGEVYVTEPFAALLALEPDTGLRCEYVGHMPSAKGYGDMRMYVLKRDAAV
jgi:class 3 adenylate cyclase